MNKNKLKQKSENDYARQDKNKRTYKYPTAQHVSAQQVLVPGF